MLATTFKKAHSGVKSAAAAVPQRAMAHSPQLASATMASTTASTTPPSVHQEGDEDFISIANSGSTQQQQSRDFSSSSSGIVVASPSASTPPKTQAPTPREPTSVIAAAASVASPSATFVSMPFTPPPPPGLRLVEAIESCTSSAEIQQAFRVMLERWANRVHVWVEHHPKDKPAVPIPTYDEAEGGERMTPAESWCQRLNMWYTANFAARRDQISAKKSGRIAARNCRQMQQAINREQKAMAAMQQQHQQTAPPPASLPWMSSACTTPVAMPPPFFHQQQQQQTYTYTHDPYAMMAAAAPSAWPAPMQQEQGAPWWVAGGRGPHGCGFLAR